jgi:hypothetical protein
VNTVKRLISKIYWRIAQNSDLDYNEAMIAYTSILQNSPPALQATLLQLVEAVEQKLRAQLTPRQETIDVRALTNGLLESQQASRQRMDESHAILRQLAVSQHGLTEAQQRTEARMEQLTEAQQHTEASLVQLAAAQRETAKGLDNLRVEVADLTKNRRAMQPRLAKADGWQLEQRYAERAPSYFGRWLRQIEVLWPGRLECNLERALDEHLTIEEKDEVLRLDIILRGKTAQPVLQEEVYVALEASVTINQYDVERARSLARLLRRIGVRVAPVVAGEAPEGQAEDYAGANAVAILRNGKRQGWEQELAAA